MQYVLLLINEEAHIRELMRVAEALLRTPDLRPVAFIEDRLKHLGHPAIFTRHGIEVFTSDDFRGAEVPRAVDGVRWTWRRRCAKAAADLVGGLLRMLPNRICAAFGWSAADGEYIAVNRTVMLRRAGVAEAVLTQRSYLAVVMSEDNVELDTGVWTAVARRFGTRSIIVPYTISNTAEFAESYLSHAPYRVKASAQNRLIATLFPSWVIDYKGQRFLRSGYAKIFSVEQLGLTPPNPWLLNSGSADAIAVESQAMRDYYSEAGIENGQLVVTGSMADDSIAAALADAPMRRAALLASVGLPEGHRLLLCALPPDQNTYERPGCEFRDFDDLISFWGECLAAVKDWNVIVRPHPKTAPERLEALRRHGVAVSYDDTAAMVPLCDLYVASISATIRWAIACGKPVINYDVYQYGYQDYRGVEGVILTNTRAEFRSALDQLTGDPERLAAVSALQKRETARWGNLDGVSAQKIIDLLQGNALPPALH